MVKTPEEYFAEQALDVSSSGSNEMTPAEQAFLQKYVGVAGAKALGVPLESDAVPLVPTSPAMNGAEPYLHEALKSAESIQMIFFQLSGQLYTIPIDAVQEVIRYVTPTCLPLAPEYVAGVINLRGRVTPLLYLDRLLCEKPAKSPVKEGFIIICMRNGLQVGLLVERIHNMYTIQQNQIIWNVESQIGANAEFLCGIIDFNEKVFGIVSIDMIVDHVIQS